MLKKVPLIALQQQEFILSIWIPGHIFMGLKYSEIPALW